MARPCAVAVRLFGTGTLPGCSGIETGTLLREGDVLELDLEGIGTIRHPVVAGG